MRIRTAQCLCPSRHAILVLMINDASTSDADAVELLRTAVRAVLDGQGESIGLPAKTNPWCGICGASNAEWTFEIRRSKEFPSFEEAAAAIEKLKSAQIISRAMLDAMGLSYDAQRKRESS